jgi:hypothetical protein
MRPRIFFVAVAGPFVQRTLLAGHMAGVRAMPFAILAGVIATPFLTLLAAALLKPDLRGRAGMAAALPWVAVLVGSLLALFGLLAAGRPVQLALPLFWCVAAAHAILVGIAFRAQQALRARGVTRVAGSFVLGLGLALQLALLLPGVLVTLVPLVSGWRQLEAA